MQSIEDLQVKVAFMDDLINSLNQTVYHQQQQIDALHSKVANLSKQLEHIKEKAESPADKPPPHY